jgi:hypothetical protein
MWMRETSMSNINHFTVILSKLPLLSQYQNCPFTTFTLLLAYSAFSIRFFRFIMRA